MSQAIPQRATVASLLPDRWVIGEWNGWFGSHVGGSLVGIVLFAVAVLVAHLDFGVQTRARFRAHV
jgi:hypothetical protein